MIESRTSLRFALHAMQWCIGERIEDGFLRQAEFAERIGVGQSRVSAIERGTKDRIAKLYGKTVEWILTGSDKRFF
jgi:hypothetical protein